MYIYPDNLKAKATMWLWSLKDLAIVGIIILFSVCVCLCRGVVSASHCRSLCLSDHTGGGYDHYGFYPVCLCLFFHGSAAI